MKPVNNKSLLHFIFDQMEKLDKKEIDVQTAKAQSMLARQANSALNYEINRVNTIIKVDDYNRKHGTDIKIKNAEGVNFD
jgi:hypothetical protein